VAIRKEIALSWQCFLSHTVLYWISRATVCCWSCGGWNFHQNFTSI